MSVDMDVEDQAGVNVPNDVLNVLVVDDEPDIVFLLATALEALGGFSVTTAMGAQEALEIVEAAEKPFDGAFLDIQMPEISGIELCRVLRGLPDYGDTPIIMVTAMTERHYLRDAFSGGADDYITKPFDLAEIESRFAIARKKSRQQSNGTTIAGVQESSQDTSDSDRTRKDSFAIAGVERCVGQDAFHTFMTQSKVRFDDPVFVRTIKLKNAVELCERLSDVDYQRRIVALAKSIAVATEDDQGIFSYCGQGVFFYASETKGSLTQDMLDAAMSEDGAFGSDADQMQSEDVVLGPEDAIGRPTEPA